MWDWIADNWVWLLVGLGALVIILLMVIEGMVRRNKKKKKVRAETGVVENKDVRLSDDTKQFDEKGEAQATLAHRDIICKKGQTMTAGKNSDLKPGKYTLLTSTGGNDAFNVKIGGFVRQVKHGTVVVLADGDSICPVSETIVLR